MPKNDTSKRRSADIGDVKQEPEIIRCKDCKNWQTDWTPICSSFTPEDHFCSLVDLVTEDDFFCGYAERKEENGKSN